MASLNDGVVIRHAIEEDIPTIHALILSLAAYEHALSSVAATPSSLLSTLSLGPSPTITPQKPARCLLLFTPHGVAAGMALYFYNYSTWRAAPGIYVEDLFVVEEERKKGYGGMLLAELARECVREIAGGRLEWSVLKWNESAIGFYEGREVEAKMMDEWVGMRLDGERLERLAGKAKGVDVRD